MSPIERNTLLKKWKKWLKVIEFDLGDLLISHEIFTEIQKMHRDNPDIRKPTRFYRWLKQNYSTRLAIDIRRLTDQDRRCKRAVSLYRLIDDIEGNIGAITRKWFSSQYDRRGHDIGLADYDFNEFSRNSHSDIDLDKLERDKKCIEKISDRVKRFADKFLAHHDYKKRIRKIPTFKDADGILQQLDKLVCKYELLLNQGALVSCKPVSHNWKQPLKKAWIIPQNQIKNRNYISK